VNVVWVDAGARRIASISTQPGFRVVEPLVKVTGADLSRRCGGSVKGLAAALTPGWGPTDDRRHDCGPVGHVVNSSVTHVVGSAVTGLVVGVIVAVAIRHAHDPASAGLTLPVEDVEAVGIALGAGLVVAPVVAAMFTSVRLLAAAALAAGVGGPILALVLMLTLDGGAAGGADRFLAWTLAVATVYTLAGVATAREAVPRDVLVAALTAVLAVSGVGMLEQTRQDRWRAWDVAHHDVALVLPDLPGFEPTGMRFTSAGIDVELTGPGGTVLVDLLDREASLVRLCDSGPCWNRPGDRWSSDSVVTRRHAGRLIQIGVADGGSVVVPIDVPLRPVGADRLARLPVLRSDYAD
jgi:hypothetical protein